VPNPIPIKILIAVDFGTTYSGVALANTVEPKKSKIVTDWGKGLRGHKVPSVLKYDNGGTTGPFTYGFQALRERKEGERVHEWFKLGLDPELEERRAMASVRLSEYASTTALDPVQGEDCKILVINYLSMLGKATDDYIKKTYDEMIYGLDREYIITVPAMWSARAQNATRDCAAKAFKADPKRMQIIAEPEAAGVCALATMPRISLKEGDTFVICDAGGGTVDLASYEIKSLNPYIQLAGASVPTGGLCGSIFLNRIFSDYLRKRLRGYIDEWKGRDLQWLNTMLDYFEDTIKTEFTGEEADDRKYDRDTFGRRDSPRHGIVGGYLNISAKTIREKVFDPVMTEIQRVVRDHIANTKNVKAVLLAGGFGQNEYLKKCLRNSVPKKINISEIDDSQTAIVMGALIAGLPEVERQARKDTLHAQGLESDNEEEEDNGRIIVRVTSRRAPKHYGVPASELYDQCKSTHEQGKHRVKRGKDGKDRIEVMKWFISKNEEIEDGVPRTFPLSYVNDVSKVQAPIEIRCDVYSDEKDPPSLYPHTAKHPNPDLKRPLVTLKIELNDADLADMPIEEDAKGNRVYKVDFDVHMTLYSAKMTFVLVRGKKVYEPKDVTFY